jgi:hypothetical protein
MAYGDGPHYGCGVDGSYGWSFGRGTPGGGQGTKTTPAQTGTFESAESNDGSNIAPLFAVGACAALVALALGSLAAKQNKQESQGDIYERNDS